MAYISGVPYIELYGYPGGLYRGTTQDPPSRPRIGIARAQPMDITWSIWSSEAHIDHIEADTYRAQLLINSVPKCGRNVLKCGQFWSNVVNSGHILDISWNSGKFPEIYTAV